MNSEISLYVFLLGCFMTHELPTESMNHQSSLQNYNNFWDGAVGGRGYWGRTPPY